MAFIPERDFWVARLPCTERIPSKSRADGSFINTYVTEPLARVSEF